jgi:hypothetical protein
VSPAVQYPPDLHRFQAGQAPEASYELLGCKHSKITSEDQNVPLSCGNVELRGLEPLASCMPCNSSAFPAWGSMTPIWDYRALESLRVPVSLPGMAVHLAVRTL